MNRARSKTLLLDAKKQTCMDTLGRKIGNDEEEEKERRARSLAMPARQSAKSPRMGKLKSHVRCEWSRSMRTTRSSTNLCCRRRDRIFSRAFLAPAFTSCFHEIGCLPRRWWKATSPSTCISADYLRLCTSYTTPTSTIHTHRLYGDVVVDIST